MKTQKTKPQRITRTYPGKRRRKRAVTLAPSFKAAAASLGVSWELVRWASDQGCPAFDQGRVKMMVLRAWLGQHAHEWKGAGADGTLKDQKLTEEVRKLRIANDTKMGTLVKRADVCETLSRIFGRLRPEVERKIIHELPVSLCGVDVPSGRIVARRIADEIFAAFAECSNEWEA